MGNGYQGWRQAYQAYVLPHGGHGRICRWAGLGGTATGRKTDFSPGTGYRPPGRRRGIDYCPSKPALYQGDEISTGPASRAAILGLDESQIKLNENTTLFLRSVAPSPRLRLTDTIPGALESVPRSLYKLLKGELWLRNNKEEFRFEMETPAVTATIRGTEFNLRVLPDGASFFALLEGRLLLSNSYGEVDLRSGEEGVAYPGKAPFKRVLVQPTDAVQWVLYYPGFISYRDLPLSGPGSGSLTTALEAYDQGRLAEAQQEAELFLSRHPNNGLALTLLGWISLQRHQPQEALDLFQAGAGPGLAGHGRPGSGPIPVRRCCRSL